MRYPKTCQIDGCNGAHQARGWCEKHYVNWHQTGNPLGNGNGPGPASSLTADQVAEVRRRVRQRFEAPHQVAVDMGCTTKTVRAALKPGYKPKDAA